jgi:nucleoside-diphosphate-sugar epimerase
VTTTPRSLVTGGAGFIGRWVVARLLRQGHRVTVLDDLSNGRRENVREFEGNPLFEGLREGDVADPKCLKELFTGEGFDQVFHLAASIHVQKSIDDPWPTFRNDAEGTFRLLETCREQFFTRNALAIANKAFDYEKQQPLLRDRRPRVTVMSTCMVYDLAADQAIAETHPYRPASPYAAAKIAADALAISYFHSYSLPVTVVRPFNTYGPCQKSNSEGGVVSIFLMRDLAGEPLNVKGSGLQTRDLLYVEDCAEFILAASTSREAEGQIINAGTGSEVSILDLAAKCCTGSNTVQKVPHDHPQAEIMRLRCDSSKASRLLGWKPTISLDEGLRRTRAWLADNRWAW